VIRYIDGYHNKYQSRLWPEKLCERTHGLISRSEDEEEGEKEDNEDEEEQEDDRNDSDYEPEDYAASDSE
jgi:hypothetical protein